MILLIISICALLLFVLVLIFTAKGDINEDICALAVGVFLGIVLITVLFICAGNCKPDLERKHELEVLLVNDCNANTISKAQKYNKDVDKYNNYWCRFNIEDRSEYYIDIDSFLNKSKVVII